MIDVKEHLIQEKEIGDVVFNTDNTNIYNTNRSINNDRFKDKPDMETYIFNNNLQTKLYYRENGIVLPIRHHNKIHINKDNGYGVYIVKYYYIYQENFDTIGDIIRYNILQNNDKSEDMINNIVDILRTNNKPLNTKIQLRFISFVPESTILTNNIVNVNNISILKDVDRKYTDRHVKRKYKTLTYEPSMQIEISYSDNTDEEMYYKLGNSFIKIKKHKSHYTQLDLSCFIDEYPVKIAGYPIDKESRNTYGLYTKEEVEKEKDKIGECNKHNLDKLVDIASEKFDIINDIKKAILNDDQARLEVQKAIFKLTKEVNQNELKKSVNDYKELVNGNKSDTTLVSDMLKIFKSLI